LPRCLLILCCASASRLQILQCIYFGMMSPWLLTPSSQTLLLLMVGRSMHNYLLVYIPYQMYMVFPGVLTDQIIGQGAPMKLISDSAKLESSNAICNILCTYSISSWQSESYHQHKNPAERCYQMVKCMCNTILYCIGAPVYC
jgi:hypothetical protein